MIKKFLAMVLMLALFGAVNGATHYVNLNVAYDHAKDGLTSGNALGGAIGIKRALDTCAAGDTILVGPNGNADMRKIKWLSYETLRGTFARGDTLNNLSRAGVAVCYQDSAATKILAEVQSGSFLNTDSIINQPNTAGAKLNAAPTMPGIVISKTSGGTYNTPIKIIGVNSSWVEDGTYDTLDGNLACVIMVIGKQAGTWKYFHISNLVLRRSSASALLVSTGATVQQWIVYNCKFENSTYEGISGLTYSTVDKITAIGNRWGCYNMRFSTITNSFFALNSVGANQCGTAFDNCVFYKNTTGVVPQDAAWLYNCILDSNVTGLSATGNNNMAIKCKFTDNTTTSIAVTGQLFMRDNIFIGNGNGNALTVTGAGQVFSTGTSVYTGTIGYTDRATYNFSPTINATGRRVPTNIGGK